MAEEIGEVVDIATGALVARAVEPEAGEGNPSTEQECLNCGAHLQGNHCHTCGQKAKVHRSLTAFGHDILHSVLHFDGKIWRTLPLLAWRPGQLTYRYIHGERAKFVSPIALFLFMVFLSFAVFSWIVPHSGNAISVNTGSTPDQLAKDYASDKKDIQDDIAEYEADRKEAIAEKSPTANIDAKLSRKRAELQRLDERWAETLKKQKNTASDIDQELSKITAKIANLEKELAEAKRAGASTIRIEASLSDERMGLQALTYGKDIVKNGMTQNTFRNAKMSFFGIKALEDAGNRALQNPQLFLYKVQSNAYKFGWALIPISTPFVWLLFFWKRKFHMFDHAVFVTYSLCFMLGLAAVGAILISIVGDDGSPLFPIIITALSFYPPFHMYRQLRDSYQLSRGGALVRLIPLITFALIAIILFTVLITVLGITG